MNLARFYQQISGARPSLWGIRSWLRTSDAETMGNTPGPADVDASAASGRAKPATSWMRAWALLIGGSVLGLHAMWLLSGRTPVQAREFAGAFANSFVDSAIRFYSFPLLGTVNLVLILALMGIFICLLGRWIAGTLLAVALVIGLSAANQLKQQMLQEPILWQDFVILRDMIGLLRGFVAWWHLLLLGAALLAVVLVCWLDRPLRLPRLWPRLRGLGLVFCCLVPVVLMTLSPLTADRYIGLPALDDTRRDYQEILVSYARSHGPLVSLLLGQTSSAVMQPAGYERHTVSEVASKLAEGTPRQQPTTRPHVIAIMYESLWDPTRLPGVTITPDPMATIRNPPGNALTFQTLSPVFGRPTANVEFEFLTGMSTSFLPMGVIPYMGMVHDEVPSLPKLFRENGYRAMAIHPYTREFWHRDQVYPALGFEEFEDVDGFYPADIKGRYVSDDAVASHIIRCIDQARTPTFLFAVTMQNHAPHEHTQYTNYDVRISHNIPDLNEDGLTAYTQGVYDADRSFRRLIEHFSQSPQPVVLVAFGDHLVPLSSVYMASGYVPDEQGNSPSQRVKMRATPAVLWTNLPDALPQIAPISSPNFIPPSLLGFVGISDPYFTGLLGQGRGICPGLSRYVNTDPSGKAVLGEPEGSRSFLRDYRLLQHDLLLGKRYALPWLRQPERHSTSAMLQAK